MKSKYLLLTFDMEEFFPYLNSFPRKLDKSLEISYKGWLRLKKILNLFSIKSTFFFTIRFALFFPKDERQKIKQMGEIALHSTSKSEEELIKEREALLKIFKSKIYGVRFHEFRHIKCRYITNSGLVYDSSIHPTVVPGRYFNLFSKTKVYRLCDKVIEVPPTTIPVLKIPLSFLWFRFMYKKIKLALELTYHIQDFICLYFHPWEFYEYKNVKRVPFYVKFNSGKKLEKIFFEFLKWVKEQKIEIMSIRDYLSFHGFI